MSGHSLSSCVGLLAALAVGFAPGDAPAQALQGYRRRRDDVPEAWLQRVEIAVGDAAETTFREDRAWAQGNDR